MSSYWRIAGNDLNRVNVEVFPINHQGSGRKRQKRHRIHKGGMDRDHPGTDLDDLQIRFRVLDRGRSGESYDEYKQIVELMEDNEYVVIQRPDHRAVQAFRKYHLSWFAPEAYERFDPEQGRTPITLLTEWTHLVVPQVLSGEDDDELWFTGQFKKQGDGTFKRDDGTNTGSKPLVRVPKQFGSYPLAIRTSDKKEVTPTLDSETKESTPEGGERRVQDYDVSDFLHPNKAADMSSGDVGLYKFATNPTQAALEYHT